MTADRPDIVAEYRLARRLSRLFRVERAGRFERHAAVAARRLIERRGRLIEALIATEQRRREAALPPPRALHEALLALADEARRSGAAAADRLTRVQRELRLRRAGAPGSGMRGAPAGRLLGRG